MSGVEGGVTGTGGRTRCHPAAAATGSSTSASSVIRAWAQARICSRIMCSILEDPRNCRLTGPGSPDTKAQLSHRSEVFSSIRHARSCRSPKYLSTVSPGHKQHETNVSNPTKGSGAKASRRACFTCCKSSLWSRVNRRYTDRVPPLSLSGRIHLMLTTPHISHTSSTCSNHSDTMWSDKTPWNSGISWMSNALPAICVWLHTRWNDGCSPIRHQQNTAVFHFKLSLFYLHQISPLHIDLSRSPP